MSIKGIVEIVWSKYGLIGVVVIIGLLVGLDQVYGFGLGEMIKGLFGQ